MATNYGYPFNFIVIYKWIILDNYYLKLSFFGDIKSSN